MSWGAAVAVYRSLGVFLGAVIGMPLLVNRVVPLEVVFVLSAVGAGFV